MKDDNQFTDEELFEYFGELSLPIKQDENTYPDNINIDNNNNFENEDVITKFSIEDCILESYYGKDEIIDIPCYVGIINPHVFSENKYVKEVKLPYTVTHICEGAFERCTYLEKINIPDGLKYIDNGAFERCNIVSPLKFPKSMVYIDDNAFMNCHSLYSIELNDGLEYVGEKAFTMTDIRKLVVPASCKLKNNSFSFCDKLSAIKYCDGTEQINLKAFNNCLHLEQIIIPDSVINVDFLDKDYFVSRHCVLEFKGVKLVCDYEYFRSYYDLYLDAFNSIIASVPQECRVRHLFKFLKEHEFLFTSWCYEYGLVNKFNIDILFKCAQDDNAEKLIDDLTAYKKEMSIVEQTNFF